MFGIIFLKVYKMKYREGQIVKGCVTGIEQYGVFVGFDEYYTGLIHISEISDGYVKKISDYVNIGEMIKTKIIGVDDDNYQLKLSIKNIDYRITNHVSSKIKETGSGFELLKQNLEKWINEKNVDKND